MDDPGGVRLGEPVGDLAGDVEETPRRERPCLQDVPERLSLDELHGDENRRVRRPDVVDRDDVVVVEAGGRARFLLEPLVPVGIGRELGREHLDRHVAPEAGVPRAVDLPHPAGAERREDLVRAKFLSRCQCHACVRGFYVPPSATPARSRARRIEFPTTKALESTIAPAATTGRSSPNAAIPTPIAL